MLTDARKTPGKNWALLVCLAAITVFWAFYGVMSQYNLDLYRDMLENYSWGIRWQWSNSKHPPLFGWVTAIWFELFPRTNLAYKFLSAFNISVSLGIMLMISKRYLDKDQQFAALAVALALPLLGFGSLTYNANSAMLPFWAATFLFYLRILEKQRLADFLAAGLFAGLAMLTKYHSAVLLLAIFIHSIADREVRPLWRSWMPWAAASVFIVVLLPHILWLSGNKFGPIRFAALDQGARDVGNVLFALAEFPIAQILYAVPGLLVLGLYRRPKDGYRLLDFPQFSALRQTPAGRALLAVGFLPTLLTMILGLVLWVPLTSNWSVPFFIFAPILLVLLLPKPIANRKWRTAPGFIVCFIVSLIALSPLIRSTIIAEARQQSVLPIIDIAIAAEDLWNKETGVPLAFVGGESTLSYGASFYAASRPYSISGANFTARNWIDGDDLERAGFMVLCSRPQCVKSQQSNSDIDVTKKLIVPAIDGAGGPEEYEVFVFISLPK